MRGRAARRRANGGFVGTCLVDPINGGRGVRRDGTGRSRGVVREQCRGRRGQWGTVASGGGSSAMGAGAGSQEVDDDVVSWAGPEKRRGGPRGEENGAGRAEKEKRGGGLRPG